MKSITCIGTVLWLKEGESDRHRFSLEETECNIDWVVGVSVTPSSSGEG